MRDTKNTKETRGTVLVVEDEPAARTAITRIFETLGFTAHAAANSEDALRTAASVKPDVAICDWSLSDNENGVDVAREIQQSTGSQVILMSAHPIAELRQAAIGMDVARFLKKPISVDSLLLSVAEATGR